MGVEPTAARSARPATGFEDRGSHRAPTTPTFALRIARFTQLVKSVKSNPPASSGGCRDGSWLASTPEAALEGIRQVAADVVADLKASGELVPEPIAIRQYSGKFMVRIPPGLHRRLALEAAEAGISLNRLASAKLGQ